MVLWGNMILRNAKPILKKTILFVCLLLLPFVLSADITVNWQPQVGISYTWQDTNFWNPNFSDFVPGFSGGADVEIGFFEWFGVKAGLNVSQVVRAFSMRGLIGDPITTPIYDSVTGATITALAYSSVIDEITVEIPVLAVFYAGVTDYLQLYCGLGAAPGFVTWSLNNGYDANGEPQYSRSTYRGIYVTSFTADAGLHWEAGPGKVTAGFVYKLTPRQEVSPYTIHNWFVNNLKFYAGYLF